MIMLDDIYGLNQESCLTDGSGYISKNLAKIMPQSVMQGKIGTETNIPAAFQVRVFVPSMGIFKGTLVIREDLGEDSIALRPSMLKVKKEKTTTNSDSKCCNTDQVVIEVVNTSRAPRYHVSNLNHQLLHALHARGIGFELLEDLLRSRIEMISNMCDDREHIR